MYIFSKYFLFIEDRFIEEKFLFLDEKKVVYFLLKIY